MDFMSLMNISTSKSKESSIVKSEIKALDSDINGIKFEDILSNNDNIQDTKKSVNELREKDSTTEKKIKLNIEDKKSMLENLKNEFKEYSEEDLINVVNLSLLIELIDNSDKLDIESVEFITESELFKESKDDFLGNFTLGEGKLYVPVFKDLESIVECAPDSEDKILYQDTNFDKEIDNKSLSISTENNEYLSEIIKYFNDIVSEKNISVKEFKESISKNDNMEDLNKVTDILKNNDVDTIFENKKNALNALDKIDAMNRDSELHIVKNGSDVLSAKNNTDLFKDLNKLFNVTEINIDKKEQSVYENQENTVNFNRFFANQRINSISLSKSEIEDKDLELLTKIADKDLSSSSMNLINQGNYRNEIDNKSEITSSSLKSIRYSHLQDDTIKTIQYMKNNDIGELTLKVKPKELGEVTISLMKNMNMSDVIVTIEKEELFKEFNKNLTFINKELKNLGLKINNISVEVKVSAPVDASNLANTSFSSFTSGFGGSDSHNQNYKESQQGKANKRLSVSELDEDSVNIEIYDNKINMLA